MIRKLKIKFILINMALVTIVLCLTFIIIGITTYQRLYKESYNALHESFAKGKSVAPKKLEISKSSDNKKTMLNSMVFNVKLNMDDTIKEVIGDNINISEDVLNEIVSECIHNKKTQGTIASMQLRYLMKESDATREIAFYDLSNDNHTMFNLIKNLILVGFGSLLTFFVVSLFLAKWTLRPIEQSWEQQKLFVSDASHELKTPLTVILANIDIILAHKDETVLSQSKWVEYIKVEATRMSKMVNDLLFLAKSDASREKLLIHMFSVSDIAWSSFLPFESMAFEQEKELLCEIQPDIYMNGDEGKIKQLIFILLDNAIKYSNVGGIIRLKLKEKQEKVYLSVFNTGEAIPSEQISNIFERFYRLDESRARGNGGYGLGLSIAKSIVKMHHGKINVASNSGTGTTITVILPSENISNRLV